MNPMCRRHSSPRQCRTQLVWFFALLAVGVLFFDQDTVRGELLVQPQAIQIDRADVLQQLVVVERSGAEEHDVTRQASWEVGSATIATVDANGLLRPLTDGTTEIVVKHKGAEARIPVTITGIVRPGPVSFEHEIQPILTKARCNSGGCHGKAEGQNGFKLSLLGFDAAADYEAIIKEGRGRRARLVNPPESLLLRKATASVPHGGGLKIESDGPQYRRLLRWLSSGAPATIENDHPIVKIEVEPGNLVLRPGETWQLRVSAIDAQGGRRCATFEADYISNANHIVDVNGRGLLQASDIAGESAILVRYLGHVAVCRVTLPRPAVTFARPPENNFIDHHVWNKLTRLGIPPSDVAGDSMFLRRVFLDTIGTLPTAAEARTFLADAAPDKRSRLIDSLLARAEYADYWTMKWGDLLRTDKIKVTPQGSVGLTRWLRKQFTENRPYDELVREVLTVQGPVQSESPAAFFKAVDQPDVASRAVSQLFLGVRIECAQCHHHPSERWGQDDYVGLAGFFTGLSVKRMPDGTEAIVSRGGTDLKHPRTGVVVPARPLGAPASDFSKTPDRRQSLAEWVTRPENPFFARSIANRLWAHYLGRGLVEPIDDIRITNPATNEPLMLALEAHLREIRFDLRAFTKTLLMSRTYQLASVALETNRDDRQNFSHAIPKSMEAEVLLDAIGQTTGVPEKFAGWPDGIRAIQVWDNRMPSYFFRIFGRPSRLTVCECERSNEPSISQALHLLNSPEVNAKITHRQGLARRLSDSPKTPDEVIDELFLGTLSRYPTADERALVRPPFDNASLRREATEDVLWTVLNTREFVFNH